MVDKLTIKNIKSFRYAGDGKSRDVRWDTNLPGFGLRVYPSGHKGFVISYRTEGRKRMMTLGDFGTLTLDQARTRARKHLVGVKDGGDPLEEKHRAAQGETFKDLRIKYLDDHARPRKKSWTEDERRTKLHVPSAWDSRKVKSISRQDIANLHAKIGATTPYEANRVLALLHKMFGLARTWGFVDKDAANPASDIEKFRERSRKRWLRPEELPALAQAIDQESNIYIRAAFWLYLLTGARRTELLATRRRDIDYERGGITLPDTKSGEPQWLPLSAPALAIVQATPALAGNPYLFPGRKQGQHLVNIKDAWNQVRERATVTRWAQDNEPTVAGLVDRLSRDLGRTPSRVEVENAAKAAQVDLPVGLLDLRLHDLRRSVGSWMTGAGTDLNTIKSALRHADIATTLIYARLGQDAAREAMEQHGRRVLEIAGKAKPQEVGA